MIESTVINPETTSQTVDKFPSPPVVECGTAGTLLKAAREEAGIHIAALAAALKVPVRKLEALEANRWDELTDSTFTRALASSVARQLKIDPAAVLLAMPSGKPVPLVISSGLGNAVTPRSKAALASTSALGWSILALLLAALGMYLLPKWLPSADPPVEVPAASESVKEGGSNLEGQSAPSALGASVVVGSEPLTSTASASPALPASTQHSDQATAAQPVQPAAVVGPEVAAIASAATTSPVIASTDQLAMVIKANSETWAEVTDNAGRVRVQRLLKAGEEQAFSDATSFSVVLGNAMAAQVFVRGQAMDLMAKTKNNVARFEVR